MSTVEQKKKKLMQTAKDFFQKLFRKKKSQKTETKISIPKLILKIFLWFSGILLSLILLILIFIDPILRFSVTKIGSMVTGLEISVGNIELSLIQGNFKMANLKVSNPDGFGAPEMLNLGSFYIAWDNNSLFTDEIIVKNIEVRNLHINAQVNQSGKLNFLAVAEKFAPATTAEPPDAATAPQKKLWIEQFSIIGFHFKWIDQREKYNINGFGVDLEELSGSLTAGSVQIKSLKVSNPENYAIDKLISVESVSVSFNPQTIYTPAPVINDVTVSGLTVLAEFNKSGDFNILAIVDSFQDIFPPENEISTEKNPDAATETIDPENGEATTQGGVKLSAFTLRNSWFHFEDDRTKIPMKIPLYYTQNDSLLFGDDTDIEILPFLHKHAVCLRDACDGVTDANQLALNFVKNAAQQGISIFTKTGGIIINGGEILIDGTKNSGKKVIDSIVEIFK